MSVPTRYRQAPPTRPGGAFAVLPARLLDDSRLTHADIVVAASVSSLAGRDGRTARASAALIAHLTGLSMRQCARSVSALSKTGWLEVRRRRDPNTGAQLENDLRLRFDHSPPTADDRWETEPPGMVPPPMTELSYPPMTSLS